ncbi:MAG: DUF262 domain-containing protein, partial [Nitrospinae bacterium]|nr:DUF262 domain-containing protein [Nitrospinota bacterium]
MSLFEDTNPRALKNLLGEIHSRTMVLPDFQRDFVWEPGATQELIVSIANNYPAGSLLRVRDAKRVFAAREFEGAPALNGQKHTFLVLDGQQRLKTLLFFYSGVFNQSPGDRTQRVFKLANVQEQFEGLTYETLQERDRLNLDNSVIHATVVKQDAPPDDDTSMYHIFARLNQGGRR